MRKFFALLGAAIAVWIALSGRGSSHATVASRAPNVAVSARAPGGTRAPSAVTSSVGFRSREQLAEHYHKHGAEFGTVSMNEYLSLAQSLRDAPVGSDVIEVTRPVDGVVSRFDRVTGAFLAADADGTIRTFFKPNDGESYFRRQAKRRPSP